MRIRILKKGSSSKALPLVMILVGLLSMVEDCGAMEVVAQEETSGENRPLLTQEDVTINGIGVGGNNGDQSEVVVSVDPTLVDIDIPQSLITKPDSAEAVKGMEALNRRVRYDEIVTCEAEETQTGREFFEKVVSLKICDNKEDIPDTLLDLALAAGKQDGPVQTYFNNIKAQLNGTIEKINELKTQNDALKRMILIERDEAQTELNHLKQIVKYLSIGMPVAVGCTGLIIWGLTWYLGGEK